jgi:hypothetical protein
MCKCSECEFWFYGGENEEIGSCQVDPPRIIDHLLPLAGSDLMSSWDEAVLDASCWPRTYGWNWCGKFVKAQHAQENNHRRNVPA